MHRSPDNHSQQKSQDAWIEDDNASTYKCNIQTLDNRNKCLGFCPRTRNNRCPRRIRGLQSLEHMSEHCLSSSRIRK